MADSSKPRARTSTASRKTADASTRSRNSSAKTDQHAGKSTGDPNTAGSSSPGLDPDWLADVQGLSFQEARTALELAMAQLQSDALEVEEMANHYRRAEAYAKRFEAVLQQVEQEVIQWDAEDTAPTP